MPVPYTFATQSGNIPLTQLDANFSNVKAFADSAGFVTESAQLNITRVGTLSTLTVGGNLTAPKYFGDGSALTGISAQNVNAENLVGATLSANVTQSSLTQLGALIALTVTGPVGVSGSVTGSSFIGNGYRLTSLNAANLVGSVSNAVYATTAGSASSASTATAADTATYATAAGTSLIAGTVTTNAQPNITSTGTLTSLNVTNNLTVGGVIYGTFSGNVSGNLVVPGSNTQVLFNNNGNAGANSNFTFNSATGVMTVTGNIVGGNIIGNGSALTNLPAANIIGAVANATYATFVGTATTAGTVTTAAQPNITSVGTLSSLSVTGNVTGGNLISSGNIATLSSIKRVIHVSNASPTGSDGAVGDIWYKTY